jgi:biotin transport system substrate-specific component
VFAQQSSGWSVLEASSVTGGYLIGMLLAATLVGRLTDRGWGRRPLHSLLAMAAGSVVVYAVGAAWLAQALGVGPVRAWELGVQPFLVGDTLKVVLAGALLPVAWRAREALDR